MRRIHITFQLLILGVLLVLLSQVRVDNPNEQIGLLVLSRHKAKAIGSFNGY